MPATKSAEKRVRVTERKRLRNKPVRTMCKTDVAKAERLIFLGDLKGAEEAVAEAITSLDKAAEKGIIHRNNAARRKARLMKKLNQFRAEASAPTAAAPAAAKAAAKPKAKAAKAKPKAAKPKAKAAKPKAKAAKPKAETAKAKPKAAKPKAAKPKAEKAKKPSPEKSEAES